MSGTENVGAPPPPATDGPAKAPDTKAWNAKVAQALVEGAVPLLGGMMMQMMNASNAAGEEGG